MWEWLVVPTSSEITPLSALLIAGGSVWALAQHQSLQPLTGRFPFKAQRLGTTGAGGQPEKFCGPFRC